MTNTRIWSGVWAFLLLAGLAPAQEAVTLQNVVSPTPNRKDEALAKSFDLQASLHFLDTASLDWQKTKKCFTCHTNYAYLYARPLVQPDAPAHREVRQYAEDLVAKRWPKEGPRWDAEVVATAAALAFNDAATTGKLHPLTRKALDRMWTVQREDGGWTWLKCNWPPLESDDHYGVTLAALAATVAPEQYADSPAARKGLEGIRGYLKKNPPTDLHHKAMMLWVSRHWAYFLTAKEREAIIKELTKAQKPDGGWNLATLGAYQRADKKEQDTETSDGYATGFVLYVLLRAGVLPESRVVARGVHWLKNNQRESGRWFTRSANRDTKHYISHAGTAFAIMALAEAHAIPRAVVLP